MKKEKNNIFEAHIAILAANVIFGLGVPVTKFLLNDWVTPMTYMAFRCVGATLIFWAIAVFLPKEPVKRRDLLVIMAGGLLGFVISQTLTAWALQFTTPVYFSLIATLTPIATMLMAAMFLGERITGMKTAGVLLAIVGAALMVVVRWQSETGSNDLLGIALAILSVLTWVVYLLITRKVSQKYSAVTQMKWVFLVSSVAVLPFAVGDIPQTRFFAVDGLVLWGFGNVFHRCLCHGLGLFYDSLRNAKFESDDGEHLYEFATRSGFVGRDSRRSGRADVG